MRSPNNLVSMCNLFGLSEDVGPLVNIGLLAKQFWLVSAEQSMNFNIPIYASDYTLGFIPKMDTSEKGISVRGLLPDPNPRVPKYCRVSGRVSG